MQTGTEADAPAVLPTPRLKFAATAAIDDFVAARPGATTLILLLVAFIALWPYRHFAGDDAYITFRFARNFAGGHGFAFNPDLPVYGSTAPLWVFLIAGVHHLGLDVPDSAHALNWIFLTLNILVFVRLSSQYLGRSMSVVVATLLLILDPWFVRWSLSGMENGLALCLLMSLLLAQRYFRNTGRINYLSPVFAALAGLCRPEMCLLCVLMVLDNGLFERRRKFANIAAGVAVGAIVLLPWAWYAHTHFDSIVPTTIRAKLSKQHALSLLRTLQYFATFWPLQALAVALVFAPLALRLPSRPLHHRYTADWFLPVAWALILPAFYIVGGAPVAGRYMMFGLPCYLIIGVTAWAYLSQRRPLLVAASILATFALVGLVQYKYCWYLTHWSQGMDPKMISLATTLREESKPTAVVAGDQIGVLGYFSDRRVLDTYGLASPEVLPYRSPTDDGPLWRYVLSQRPQYLFTSEDKNWLAQWAPEYRDITLVRKEDVQREGSGSVGATITYYLYRTPW